MRKILWIKQSFHIPYDMNLLNKTFQFNYKWLFVDKNHKIQPLRLSRDLILQGPKVLVGTPVVMGTRELVPAKFWKPLARLSNIFTRLIVSDIVIYIQFSIWFFFQGALFESNHYDENDVQTISHRCDVQSFKKMKEYEANQKIDHEQDDESNDKYYLAGTHNAIEKTVHFAPGVLKCDDWCTYYIIIIYKYFDSHNIQFLNNSPLHKTTL